MAYAHGEVPDRLAEFVKRRRPDLDPSDVIPVGHDGLVERLKQFVDVGASKFVVLPLVEPEAWTPELEALAESVLPLEN